MTPVHPGNPQPFRRKNGSPVPLGVMKGCETVMTPVRIQETILRRDSPSCGVRDGMQETFMTGPSTLERLWQDLAGWLLSYAGSLLGDRSLAEDALQSVFTRAKSWRHSQ